MKIAIETRLRSRLAGLPREARARVERLGAEGYSAQELAAALVIVLAELVADDPEGLDHARALAIAELLPLPGE